MILALSDRFSELLLQEIESGGKLLFVIAGHNGAGKSTYYREYLKAQLEPHLQGGHIDPDAMELEIKNGYQGPPLSQEELSWRALELADRIRQENIERGEDFSFETVFSDSQNRKISFLQRAIAAQYTVALLFIGLDSPELSRQRVADRVTRNGHDVKEEKIFSRYPRVLSNIQRATKLVHVALLVDNSETSPDGTGRYREVALYHRGGLVATIEAGLPAWFDQIKQS